MSAAAAASVARKTNLLCRIPFPPIKKYLVILRKANETSSNTVSLNSFRIFSARLELRAFQFFPLLALFGSQHFFHPILGVSDKLQVIDLLL